MEKLVIFSFRNIEFRYAFLGFTDSRALYSLNIYFGNKRVVETFVDLFVFPKFSLENKIQVFAENARFTVCWIGYPVGTIRDNYVNYENAALLKESIEYSELRKLSTTKLAEYITFEDPA